MTRRTMADPGPKATHILAYLTDYIREHGYPPSAREIAAEHGIAVSWAYYLLRRLEAEGRITRARNVARSIVVKAN